MDREKGDISAMKTAISILESGNVMSMFPEGTRSKTGELGEFKKGAAFISYRANVPIIPMKIEGTYKIFSKLILKIGEPIYPIKDKNEMTELLRQSIENL